MPVVQLFGEDEELQGRWVAWPDQDGVEFLLRPVPPATYERFERQVDQGLKTRELMGQGVDKAKRRGLALTRKAAAYALLDSRGFEFVTRSPEVAAALSAALGSVIGPGQVVPLDGKWTDEVKEALFRYLPRLAAWIDSTVDDMAVEAVEAENARGKT